MSEILIEQIDFDSITNEVIEEQVGVSKSKKFYITGPMLVSEQLNGNKRMYPKPVIEREVQKYQQIISEKRSCGECEHPSSSSINLERISHLVTELKMDGNIAVGKARILESMPLGKVLKNLMEEGVKVGVSSRGLGSLKNNIVQSDYSMVCIDAVFQPSGPGCFMQTMVENREWVLENGILIEKEIDAIKAEADKIVVEHKFSTEEKQAAFLKLFQDSLIRIAKKK